MSALSPPSPRGSSTRPRRRRVVPACALLGILLTVSCDFIGSLRRIELALPADSIGCTNHPDASGPWSFHIVRWPRHLDRFQLRAVHADDHAVGLAVLSDLLRGMSNREGRPIAAINADFYQRDRAFAGDPRGIQIDRGRLISAPRSNAVAVWLDATGTPHLGTVESRFAAVWPDRTRTPFALNEEPSTRGAVLYTPDLGEIAFPPATTSPGAFPARIGRELVLEPEDDPAAAFLRIGETRPFRVREIRPPSTGLALSNTLVLSLGADVQPPPPDPAIGDRIQLTTETLPDLRGVVLAIGGGPALLQRGRIPPLGDPEAEDYQTATMLERHPRSAFGWNRDHFFLVQVDGRQKEVSVGMTLEEFARALARFGCEEALNFDGGGSSAIWFEGRIRNRPCDGFERSIANALVLVDTGHPGPRP